MKKLSSIIYRSVLLSSILSPTLAHAQTGPITTDFGPASNFGQYLGIFFKWAIPLSGSLCVLVFVYAGYLYMTSQGNQERITSAKDWIMGAILGILLLFTAYALLKNVIGMPH